MKVILLFLTLAFNINGMVSYDFAKSQFYEKGKITDLISVIEQRRQNDKMYIEKLKQMAFNAIDKSRYSKEELKEKLKSFLQKNINLMDHILLNLNAMPGYKNVLREIAISIMQQCFYAALGFIDLHLDYILYANKLPVAFDIQNTDPYYSDTKFNIYNHVSGMVLKLFFISIIAVLKNRMPIDVIKSSLIKNNSVACVSFLHLEKIDEDLALNSDLVIEKNGQKYFMLIDNGYIYGGSRVPDFFLTDNKKIMAYDCATIVGKFLGYTEKIAFSTREFFALYITEKPTGRILELQKYVKPFEPKNINEIKPGMILLEKDLKKYNGKSHISIVISADKKENKIYVINASREITMKSGKFLGKDGIGIIEKLDPFYSIYPSVSHFYFKPKRVW